MNDDSAPFARLACFLSASGVRDAIRKGEWTGEKATYDLDPDSPLWDRFFSFDPDVEFNNDEFSESVALGAVLVVGRPMEVLTENSEPELLEIGWDYGEVWLKPNNDLRLGVYRESTHFDTYFSASELLDQESTLRASAYAAKEKSLQEIMDTWRKWVIEDGVGNVNWALERTQEIDHKYLNSELTKELEEAVRLLTSSLTKYNAAKSDDNAMAQLMESLLIGSKVINRAASTATQAAVAAKEMEDAKSWASEHGSARLRKAIDLGLLRKSLGIYRDERLQLERPGWSWVVRKEEYKDIVNPSEKDLDALFVARESDEFAQLRFRPNDRAVWITGIFLKRQVIVKASDLIATKSPGTYAFDEEPF